MENKKAFAIKKEGNEDKENKESKRSQKQKG